MFFYATLNQRFVKQNESYKIGNRGPTPNFCKNFRCLFRRSIVPADTQIYLPFPAELAIKNLLLALPHKNTWTNCVDVVSYQNLYEVMQLTNS